MTRDEAAAIYKKHFPASCAPLAAIDMLVEMGVLKLDPPFKTPTDRALDTLNRHIISSGNTLTSQTLLDLMNRANVRIVDKS